MSRELGAMRLTRVAVSAVAVMLAFGGVHLEAQSAYDLFQKALAAERTDGNLREAIEHYERVVVQSSADRPLAARALLRLAECHQKAGDGEVQAVYARIVREYPEQREAVSIARARLAAAAPSRTAQTTLRRVWTGPKVEIEGSVSADGRLLSFVDWDTGDLAIHDLAAGADRRLTHNPPRSAEFAQESTISRDGRRVAFAWFNGTDRYELRMLDVKGLPNAAPVRLLDVQEAAAITPHDWSPDGRQLAVAVTRLDGAVQIGLVDVARRSFRALKSTDWRGVRRMFFSPDGARLGFDLATDDTDEQRDIHILAVDGSQETRLESRGQDLMLGWSPDGSRVLFSSNRSGTMALWAQRMSGGKPLGDAELLRSGVGTYSLGVTAAGALFVGARIGTRDINLVSMDVTTGRVTTSVAQPFDNFGWNIHPDWSPDGTHLAYVATDEVRGRIRTLAIRPVDGGAPRHLVVPLAYIQLPRWSPDGRSIAVSGVDTKGRRGIFRIDAKTGAVAALVVNGPDVALFGPDWSTDGTRIYFRRSVIGSGDSVLVERGIESRAERELLREAGLGAPSVSPDGRYVAITRTARIGRPAAVVLVPVAGGDPIELFPTGPSRSLMQFVSWTPDGRNVLVRAVAAGQPSDVQLIPVAGGPSRVLDLVAAKGNLDAGPIRVHPDGQRFAFASNTGSGFEVWAVEHFLPLGNAGR